MKQAVLYIHGKGGSPEEADYYRGFCDDWEVFGLDYQTATPWETKEEILPAYETLRRKYGSVLLIANSIGAYFAMNALREKKVERAFFVSPIVDMEKLISDMMLWANVTEQELRERQVIPTSFGETLSWEYFCYVRAHPIVWNTATEILYAGKDNLTSYETISRFARETHASLTVMEDGEHWFHTGEQLAFLDAWLKSVI